ncbi:MAG: esterase [Lachnospiraceae bacterium]|nr:esterase [Lachnospiraceae bacterium]
MGVVRYTFFSSVLREQTNIMAIIPTYEPWKNSEGCSEFYKNYDKKKTLYILHGGSDDSSLYLRRTNIEEYAYERNMAVIFPEVRNSFYSNMIYGKKYFDFLTEELPRVVENVFPLSDKREDRFVLGNSMGSHGAFKWALNRPDFFAAACGMSGAGDLEELGFYDRMPDRIVNAFGTLEEYRESYNDFKYLCRKLLKEGADIPRFYACCGVSDGFYDGAKKFALDMKAEGFPIEFDEGEGGHVWSFWDRWLPIMMDRMLKEDK